MKHTRIYVFQVILFLLNLCLGLANPVEPFQNQRLEGTYLASEEAGGKSWGSFTYKLTLFANGSAEFYQQNVADRDTDSTYNHVGKWDLQNGIIDFKASSRFGKVNWESEKVPYIPEICALFHTERDAALYFVF